MGELIQLHDKKFKLFLSEDQIRSKVKQLAAQIDEDFDGQNPVFLCILNGSFIFAADLLRFIRFHTEMQFVKLSSYDGLESTGEIKEEHWNSEKLIGRRVIIIEDIIDSGQTLNYFIPRLKSLGVHDVTIVSFLVKRAALKFDLEIKYFGYEISNEFVVGYGLDYNEMGRNLESIYQLAD